MSMVRYANGDEWYFCVRKVYGGDSLLGFVSGLFLVWGYLCWYFLSGFWCVYSLCRRNKMVFWGELKYETICHFLLPKNMISAWKGKNGFNYWKNRFVLFDIEVVSLLPLSLLDKNHRPRRRSLTLTQLVALARYTRELLPQPLWSCMKIFIIQ